MDTSLHDFFQTSGWLEDLANGLTRLGGTEVLVAVALVSVYVLRRSGLGWWGSCGPAGSLWICAVLTAFLKDVVDRARPQAGADISSASFPSGHASNTTALVAALAFVLPSASSAISRQRAVIVAVVVSAVIGWTRLALGVHWTTDVLAGWLLGGVVSVTVMRRVLQHDRQQEKRTLPPDRGTA